MKSPAVSSIIVCGIVRDAGKGLKNNIPVIDELCSYFKDYRIYVYENDSKDDTKELLMKGNLFQRAKKSLLIPFSLVLGLQKWQTLEIIT